MATTSLCRSLPFSGLTFVSVNDFHKVFPGLGADPGLELHMGESDIPWQIANEERVYLPYKAGDAL